MIESEMFVKRLAPPLSPVLWQGTRISSKYTRIKG
jgi:hypothetical protein